MKRNVSAQDCHCTKLWEEIYGQNYVKKEWKNLGTLLGTPLRIGIHFAANPWSISSEEEVFNLETTKTTDGLFCEKVNFKNYVAMWCTHIYL